MKYFVVIFISTVFIILFFKTGYYLMSKINNSNQTKVLAESIEINNYEKPPVINPSPLPTNTPIPSPKPTATETPSPFPTATPIPQPNFTSSEIHAFMERFSGQYGIDVNVLRHIAICESGFKPSAINGPYAGLFQFNKTTWSNNRIPMGEDPNPDLRFNAEEAIQTAAYLISLGKRHLWPNCYP
jgi:hypothetical protein